MPPQQPPPPTNHEVLGLPLTATRREIRKKYIELARQVSLMSL